MSDELRMDKGEAIVYYRAHFNPKEEVNEFELTQAYVDGGRHAWFIRDRERHMKPEDFLDLVLLDRIKKQYYRCTSCGDLLDKEEVAGWPLFAGVACSACWAKHLEALEDERKKGHVCRFCGNPYGACCC